MCPPGKREPSYNIWRFMGPREGRQSRVFHHEVMPGNSLWCYMQGQCFPGRGWREGTSRCRPLGVPVVQVGAAASAEGAALL